MARSQGYQVEEPRPPAPVRKAVPAMARRTPRAPQPQPIPIQENPKGKADKSVKDAIVLLERRLLKLAGALEDQESLLLKMRQGGDVDTGIASTYKEVQGLDESHPEVSRKKELMQKIFQSNQELRERITSLSSLAE